MADTFEIRSAITKVDEDRRLAFGWANVSMSVGGEFVTDTQGDQIEPEVLEKAAYEFVRLSGEVDVNHDYSPRGRVVESVFFDAHKLEKMGIPEEARQHFPTGWWTGFYIEDDEVWGRVKSGELRAFSIGGTAVREDV